MAVCVTYPKSSVFFFFRFKHHPVALKRSIPQYDPEMRATRPAKLAKKTTGIGHKTVKCKHIAAKLEKRAMLKTGKPAPVPAKIDLKPAEPMPQRVKPKRQAVPESKLAKLEPRAVGPNAAKTSPKEIKSANKEKVADSELAGIPSVEADLDGHYELNPLMTRALESELQRIMIKVWQELPDEPPSEAERLVTDKFRTQAGDDLRNVLGLNVTKRLLNIYNPLSVKVTFTRKPEAADLKSLLRNYNCVGIKRSGAERRDYSFIVHMKTVADFDRICKDRVIRCGVARAHAAPYYNFRQCPTKLKTIYNEKTSTKDEDTDKVKTAVNAASDSKTLYSSPEKKVAENVGKKTEAPEKKVAALPNKKAADISETKAAEVLGKAGKVSEVTEKKTSEKIEKKIAQVPQDKMAELSKKTEIVEKGSKIPEKTVTEVTENKTVQVPQKKVTVTGNKIAETPIKKAAELTKKIVTPSESKAEKPKKTQISENKIEQKSAKIAIDNKKTNDNIGNKAEQVNAKTMSDKAPITNAKTVQDVKSVSVNTTKAAKLNEAKTVASLSVAPKTVTKQISKNINANITNVNKIKTGNMEVKSVNVKKKVKPKVAQVRNKLTDMIILDDEFDENDELNDDDILALMSGAIVLDECSGSDED